MPAGRPRYEGPLTPREWQVLNLIEEGLTNEEIAARLGISFAGARYHVAEIISKLGVAGRGEAAEWARAQSTNRRPWASLALLVQRLRLGSAAGVASAGILIILAVLALLVYTMLHGHPTRAEQGPLPAEAAVDGQSAQEFLGAIPPFQPLAPGQVLYTRTLNYRRYGPNESLFSRTKLIRPEVHVNETWVEAGPDGKPVRAYGRTLDAQGKVVQAYSTIDSVYRSFDPDTGELLFESVKLPPDPGVGDPSERIEALRASVTSGEAVQVSQTESELVLQSVFGADEYEAMRTEGVPDGGYEVPHYSDLDASQVVITNHIDNEGVEPKRVMSARTREGRDVVIELSLLQERAVVEEIPPEVIVLTR